MRDTANALAHSQECCEAGIRILEGKTGEDQHEEAGEQDYVLPSLVPRHAHDLRLTQPAFLYGRPAPNQEVMKQHGPDNDGDENEVSAPHPAHTDAPHVLRNRL